MGGYRLHEERVRQRRAVRRIVRIDRGKPRGRLGHGVGLDPAARQLVVTAQKCTGRGAREAQSVCNYRGKVAAGVAGTEHALHGRGLGHDRFGKLSGVEPGLVTDGPASWSPYRDRIRSSARFSRSRCAGQMMSAVGMSRWSRRYGGLLRIKVPTARDPLTLARISPDTRPATWASSSSLARCAPGVIAFPITEVANPHWGLIASRSRSMWRAASTDPGFELSTVLEPRRLWWSRAPARPSGPRGPATAAGSAGALVVVFEHQPVACDARGRPLGRSARSRPTPATGCPGCRGTDGIQT